MSWASVSGCKHPNGKEKDDGDLVSRDVQGGCMMLSLGPPDAPVHKEQCPPIKNPLPGITCPQTALASTSIISGSRSPEVPEIQSASISPIHHTVAPTVTAHATAPMMMTLASSIDNTPAKDSAAPNQEATVKSAVKKAEKMRAMKSTMARYVLGYHNVYSHHKELVCY